MRQLEKQASRETGDASMTELQHHKSASSTRGIAMIGASLIAITIAGSDSARRVSNHIHKLRGADHSGAVLVGQNPTTGPSQIRGIKG
jgi:hypothetical protein